MALLAMMLAGPIIPRQGRESDVAVLCGLVDSRISHLVASSEEAGIDRLRGALESELPGGTFDAAVDAGRRMNPYEAIDFALALVQAALDGDAAAGRGRQGA